MSKCLGSNCIDSKRNKCKRDSELKREQFRCCPGRGTAAGQGQKAQNGAGIRSSAGAEGRRRSTCGDQEQLEPAHPAGAAQPVQCSQTADMECLRRQKPGLPW